MLPDLLVGLFGMSISLQIVKGKKVKQLVDYTWQGDSYVIDLNRDKVYRNWMAIDTNQGVSIIGAYRASCTA